MTPAVAVAGGIGAEEDSSAQQQHGAGDGTFDVLFVGTGVSIGVPNLGHVLEYESAPPESARDGACVLCMCMRVYVPVCVGSVWCGFECDSIE